MSNDDLAILILVIGSSSMLAHDNFPWVRGAVGVAYFMFAVVGYWSTRGDR